MPTCSSFFSTSPIPLIHSLHPLQYPIFPMAADSPSIHRTQLLKSIAIDYCPDACHHSPSTGEIHVAFDHRGGARWRSTSRFLFGTFAARIKCPAGDTNGLNYNLYLSSLEGDKTQDEIDFEFLGKDNTSLQTNFYTHGVGSREQIHSLGFHAAEDFHDYAIRWGPDKIEWLVDGIAIRKEVRREGVAAWPVKPMFLYASVWNASDIDEGRWAGKYVGCHEPYICRYKDVRVPVETVMVEEEK